MVEPFFRHSRSTSSTVSRSSLISPIDATIQRRAYAHGHRGPGDLELLTLEPRLEPLIDGDCDPRAGDRTCAADEAAVAGSKNVYSDWSLTTHTHEFQELLTLAGAAGVRHVVELQ